MSQNLHLPWHEYAATLKPHERPMLPGSPPTPDHTTLRRWAYATVGVLVSMTGSLGNAFVTANVTQMGAAFGATQSEAIWLTVVYAMTNTCMNLLFIKLRMEIGFQLFGRIMIVAFVGVAAASLFAHDFATVLFVRGLAGICGAGMSTLGILYLLQAFPAAHRLKGIVIGIGLSSFSIPAARIFSGNLIDIGDWRSIHVLELGLALLSLAAVFSLRMPPTERTKSFEPADFLTFMLFAPGIALLCVVLGFGKSLWWTDTQWLGWALIGSILLLAAAVIVETRRNNPLINLSWLAGPDVIRLAASILLLRIVLSEQTSGAVGLMTQLGIGSDQLVPLFWLILIATIAGTLTSAFTLNPQKLWLPISISLALIAVGALIDSHATILTRPENLFFSQSLLALASALFIGPALMIGIAQMMQKGPQNLVAFIIVFQVGQVLGGLAGSAIVTTLQSLQQKAHGLRLLEMMTGSDPNVALRLQQIGGGYARTIGDASQRSTESLKLLQQQVTQQAGVLGWNDVFLVICVLAALGCVWTGFIHYYPFFKKTSSPSAGGGTAK